MRMWLFSMPFATSPSSSVLQPLFPLSLWLPFAALAGVLLDRLLGEVKHFHPLVGFGTLANVIEDCFNRGPMRRAGGLLAWLLKDRNYHRAADAWLAKHSSETIMCFVQFKGVGVDEMPRVYLARPAEVVSHLKSAVAGRGDTILNENHTWTQRAHAAGTTDHNPDAWRFSDARAENLARGTDRTCT